MKKLIQEEVTKMKQMMGLLKEGQSASMVLDTVNQDMMELGEEPLTMEEMNDLIGCPQEEPMNLTPENKSLLGKLRNAINSSTNNDELKKTFKDIKRLLRNKRQNEQAETMMIMGVSAPVAALMIIGGLLLINILIKLIRNLGGGREYIPSCRQGHKAVRERRRGY